MRKIILCLCWLSLSVACSEDNPNFEEVEKEKPEENLPEQPEEPEEPEEPQSEYEIAGEVELYNESLAGDGYVLVNDVGFNRVYLINKDKAEIRHEWELERGIGNDAELIENSELLVSLIADDVSFSFGGYGGVVQLVNPDNSVKWSYIVATAFELGHHDVERLPNGNILVLIWEGRPLDEAQESFGYAYQDDVIYAEKLIEINPNTNEIVWQWSSWDHTIQDLNQDKPNFGTIAEHPQLIDLNYRDALREDDSFNGDIMHANGIAYDEEHDLVFMSVNFYSEVWVIDHNTTTEEASGTAGDLVYRFGNPGAYNNTAGERSFFYNHGVNMVPESNNVMVYANGGLGGVTQSVVYELQQPANYELKAESDNELQVLWSFTDEDLFAPRVSGAYRMSNGNTLITEGDYGCWEVTQDKEVVWKYEGTGFTWRAYPYDKDDELLEAFEL